MFQTWLRKKGIRHETSAPRTPQQNGVAERDNRTIVEAARTYLYANRSLPLELWAEAVHCAIYVLNRVLSSTCTVITPYELWYKRKPDVSTLGIFGSYVYILIQKEDRRKLDPKGILCIYLGNSDTSKSFRCWDPLARKIKTSRERILSYLAGTPTHGLCFTGTDLSNQFWGYSDSDYSGCPDTRRSTTDTLFILNGGPISWKSRIQKPAACSSTEAEYYAAGDAAREAVWLKLLLENLNSCQTEPSTLFCDNQSTIRLIHNPEFHDRTKHIAVKFHYIRQVFSEGKIAMFFIPTTNNLADIFTKALPSVAFTAFRTAMGVIAVPSSNI